MVRCEKGRKSWKIENCSLCNESTIYLKIKNNLHDHLYLFKHLCSLSRELHRVRCGTYVPMYIRHSYVTEHLIRSTYYTMIIPVTHSDSRNERFSVNFLDKTIKIQQYTYVYIYIYWILSIKFFHLVRRKDQPLIPILRLSYLQSCKLQLVTFDRWKFYALRKIVAQHYKRELRKKFTIYVN